MYGLGACIQDASNLGLRVLTRQEPLDCLLHAEQSDPAFTLCQASVYQFSLDTVSDPSYGADEVSEHESVRIDP
jgi:hypothetical protein